LAAGRLAEDARCFAAEPARHAGRQAPASQAAEAAMPGTSRHDYRQAGKRASCGAAKFEVAPSVEHRKHKALNNRAENFHQPTRRRERQVKRFKSAGQAQCPLFAHDGVNKLFHLRHHHVPTARRFKHVVRRACRTAESCAAVVAHACRPTRSIWGLQCRKGCRVRQRASASLFPTSSDVPRTPLAASPNAAQPPCS